MTQLKKMNFSTTYDVTSKLQDDSVKQYFWHVMLRPRIVGVFLVFAMLIAAIFVELPYKPWIVGFFSAMFLFLIITWVKVYFQILHQARAGLRLMEHPKVDISLDDSLIEYASSTGTRRHHWDKIERIEETKDFVILMNGKLTLLSLPKAHFTSEALAFMKERVVSKVSMG